MSYPFGLYLRQMALEQQMRGLGFERQAAAEAAAREEQTRTAGGNAVLLRVVDPLAAKLTAYIEDAFSGRPGEKQHAAVMLRTVPQNNAAYLIAKTTLDALSINKMEQTVSLEIGRAIEEEARFNQYYRQYPALFDVILRDHKKRGKSAGFTKRVVQNRVTKAGGEWEGWTEANCHDLGSKVLDFFIHTAECKRQWSAEDGSPVRCSGCQEVVEGSGPLVVREVMAVRGARKYKPAFRLSLGSGISELIREKNNLNALLTPGFLPTVIAPKPWKSPFDGAYWTNMLDKRSRRLVKTRNMNYMEDLRHVQMPRVYEAINAVQDTAWVINKRVLNVMTEAWEIGRGIGSLPSQRNLEQPTKPLVVPPCKYSEDEAGYKAWIKTPEGQTWKAWRRMSASVYEHNAKSKSRRLQAAKVMWVAQMFEKDEALYFPHQLDFRSRVYAMPMFLHPQGPDYVRGLLRFAKGKPIKDQTAKNWLAVHGANSFGIDKVSFHERVDWVRKNEQHILDSAIDPMGTVDWWSEAENPWQFLAFCFEWQHMGLCAAAGIPFVSHIPVSLDGTCNGLQHFSAMLRDPVGGTAVNLTPSDKPQDIYAEVAHKVEEKLRKTVRECKGGADLAEGVMAEAWLAFGVDRKLTKRPVMILPYGGTLYACRKYVEEYVLGLILEGKQHPFGEDLMGAVVYLSGHIWTAIGDTVIAAKEAMQWLRGIGKLMAKAQLPIVWQTPVGFPVRQAYPQMRGAHIVFKIGGKRVYRRVMIETDGLDKEQQINGLSPNFVHSLDAAALMETTVQCLHLGIRSFAMVHDSYGTHAADTEVLACTLKEAFVALYQKHNVLAELRAAVVDALPAGTEVKSVPNFGSLNINAVLESKFFFA